MKCIHTISAVSGGSIIAAYYVIEMEESACVDTGKKLAKKSGAISTRSALKSSKKSLAAFFQSLDHNLRSRALLFSPFYHPILFIKSWWPTLSRSDIMHKEFDKWFYHNETLDHLPAATLLHDKGTFRREEKTFLP